MKLPKPLILASQSPRRRKLLKRLKVPFEVSAPDYEEISDPKLSPEEEVKLFAREKAFSLRQRFPHHLILGSDTLVALQKGKETVKMGKPKNEKEALKMLQALSGKTHQVLTGVCLLDSESGKFWEEVVVTEVKMKAFSDSEAEVYVATGEPLGKAGAYAIQEKGRDLVESWEGDFDNVVGLPLKAVKWLLRHCKE